MPQARDVWIWPAGDVLPESEWDELPKYVTDVFSRGAKPRIGSLLIGTAVRGFPDEREAVFVVGAVNSSQPVATYKDRIRLAPMLAVPDVPIEKIVPGISEPPRATQDDAQSSRRPWDDEVQAVVEKPYKLPPRLAEEATQALAREVSDFPAFLLRIESDRRPTVGANGARMGEERDAIALAVDFANMELPDSLLGAVPTPEVPLSSLIDPNFLDESEDDLLAEDIRRFDSFGQLQSRNSAITSFEDRNFRLTIMNVNRKPLEHVLGVDLVYVDEVREMFTLVQYKRLTKHVLKKGDDSGERWKYTRRSELLDQLDRMSLADSANSSATSQDWRMVSSPFWFKFVREDAFRPGDSKVLKGMYVPADYLRLALRDESLLTGPKGGFEITYGNTQYITRATFIDLTRRGMLGSNSAQTETIRAIIDDLARERQVVVSVKSRRQTTPLGATNQDGDDSSPF